MITPTSDLAVRLDARGVEWYCGHVFLFEVPRGGMSIDDLAAVPRCDRWYKTRAAREACDHGARAAPTPAAPVPVTPVEDAHHSGPVCPTRIETGVRVNRWDGSCLWCGSVVRAGAGQLVEFGGLLSPAHLDGECR